VEFLVLLGRTECTVNLSGVAEDPGRFRFAKPQKIDTLILPNFGPSDTNNLLEQLSYAPQQMQSLP
jgi:hypothetical protein